MNLGRDRVTVYRKGAEGVQRTVLTGCHYSHTDKKVSYERYGRHQRAFLLIAPGKADLKLEDRIYPGIGPEQVDWDRFLPVSVPGLSQVAWVKAVGVDGTVHHTEAGG
ncbi:MAG: hypothetical protein E7437_04685 [Ruminococcaceae bacterium]|nr:hypothetical protein [Oscillospiraceae bacterium]